jgi:3-oxoacyl-[acyl-carrier protein] reductase
LRKVAIVTGSGTGIGAATAALLAAHGWDVVINYSRRRAEAEATQAQCEAFGASTLLLQADVGDDVACKAMARATIDRWGRLDALVNNAGATTFTGLDNWDVLDVATFQRVYSVNAIGAFQMVRACASHLKESEGSVVNVSSAAGVLGRGSSIPYLMSKGALNSLTIYLARTLAPYVRVNAVCPGMVTTDWFRDGLGEEGFERVKSTFEQNAPLRRASSPGEIADAVMWLIDGARSMTGELLLLDSGRHLG